MVRKGLVLALHDQLAGKMLTKKNTLEVIRLLFDIMKDALNSGEEVKIHQFGTFWIRSLPMRKVRNPLTGKLFDAEPCVRIKFRLSKYWIRQLSQNRQNIVTLPQQENT